MPLDYYLVFLLLVRLTITYLFEFGWGSGVVDFLRTFGRVTNDNVAHFSDGW